MVRCALRSKDGELTPGWSPTEVKGSQQEQCGQTLTEVGSKGKRKIARSTQIFLISSVSSVAQSCLTLCDPKDCSMHQASLSITNCRTLLKLMSTGSVMPSHHLILCRPLLLPPIFPSIRVFSKESVLPIRWPKYWSFSFSISPSNEYSELISFRMDWLDLLASRDSQESSPTPVQKQPFVGTQLSV